MNQQPLINSKTLLEMAQKLKTPLAGNLTASEREKVRTWRDAVLRRLREIQQLIPEFGPIYTPEYFNEHPDERQQAYPNALAPDDPRREELTAEYEELQRKYRKISDILSGVEKLEEVG